MNPKRKELLKSRGWVGSKVSHSSEFHCDLNKSRVKGMSTAPRVGVGIMIAHNPLHGSGRAALPHPALALGDDAHAMQGIGMTDRRQWQPTVDETPHTI